MESSNFHGGLVDQESYFSYVGEAAEAIKRKVLANYDGGDSFGNWVPLAGASDVNLARAADFYKLYQDTNGKYGWGKGTLHAMARCGYIYKQGYKTITGEDYVDGASEA